MNLCSSRRKLWRLCVVDIGLARRADNLSPPAASLSGKVYLRDARVAGRLAGWPIGRLTEQPSELAVLSSWTNTTNTMKSIWSFKLVVSHSHTLLQFTLTSPHKQEMWPARGGVARSVLLPLPLVVSIGAPLVRLGGDRVTLCVSGTQTLAGQLVSSIGQVWVK